MQCQRVSDAKTEQEKMVSVSPSRTVITHLLICVTVEELLLSFLEEDGGRERLILGDLRGGRMEQWDSFDMFDLKER